MKSYLYSILAICTTTHISTYLFTSIPYRQYVIIFLFMLVCILFICMLLIYYKKYNRYSSVIHNRSLTKFWSKKDKSNGLILLFYVLSVFSYTILFQQEIMAYSKISFLNSHQTPEEYQAHYDLYACLFFRIFTASLMLFIYILIKLNQYKEIANAV